MDRTLRGTVYLASFNIASGYGRMGSNSSLKQERKYEVSVLKRKEHLLPMIVMSNLSYTSYRGIRFAQSDKTDVELGLPEVTADIFHAYQIVKQHNVPAENIITFAYDDIAFNTLNPFKGQVFNDYAHKDVYEGVQIDYKKEDVTPENFLRALKGDKELELAGKKVLNSGPEDYVFIYFSDHGADGIIAFPEDELSATDLNKTLSYMHTHGMYKKLVLYVEACESGSMFEGILPSNIGIYVTTAANSQESSWAAYCQDQDIDSCLADEYSHNWLVDSEKVDIMYLYTRVCRVFGEWHTQLANPIIYLSKWKAISFDPSQHRGLRLGLCDTTLEDLFEDVEDNVSRYCQRHDGKFLFSEIVLAQYY
ncbi:legumain, partial [Clonorchis sinensis]